jgi:hypothetical protein
MFFLTRKEPSFMLKLAAIDINRPEDREKLIQHLADLTKLLSYPLVAPHSSGLPLQNPGAVFGHIPTQWPRIGGDTLVSTPSGVFESADFRRLYKPGQFVQAYAAGCTGLRALANKLDMPLRKVGLTQNDDVRIRISEFSRDSYGGTIRVGDDFRVEAGFDNYVVSQLVYSTPISPKSPAQPLPRSISIRLPLSLSFDAFELLLQEALDPISLSSWIQTGDGVRHLAALRASKDHAARFTDYRYGGGVQPKPAKEILIFRPRQDGDRLVALIERIILRHLGINS